MKSVALAMAQQTRIFLTVSPAMLCPQCIKSRDCRSLTFLVRLLSEPLLALCSFPSVALFCLGTVAGRGLGDRTPGAELWEGPRAGCGGMTSKLLLIDNDPGTS